MKQLCTLLTIGLMLLGAEACAQATDTFFVIDSVIISGNERTQTAVITRELTVSAGDTVAATRLPELIVRNYNLLQNTRLFTDVRSDTVHVSPQRIRLLFTVQERWYIFPIPYFALADRNFNVWRTRYDFAISRVTYGINFTHFNFRGRRERLTLIAHFGFEQEYQLKYEMPYIDRGQRSGLSFDVGYLLNRQLPVRTDTNRLIFFSSTERLNPDYFLDERRRQRRFSLTYNFEYDRRDYRSYPTSGYRLLLQGEKHGLRLFGEVDYWLVSAEADYFRSLGKGFFAAAAGKLRAASTTPQPYRFRRALGYNKDVIRGYELSVADGEHFALAKTALKYRLLRYVSPSVSFLPPAFNPVPLDVYLKVYGDAGYVRAEHPEPGNRLSNRAIYGVGAGIDLVSYYDRVMRIEYSFNSSGESGVFLHFVTAI